MERIEGLSIGLNLDSIKVDSGLKSLNSKLKLVNSEMKANMSAFDKSDKSIEKYETRLNGLNKKLEVQKAITDRALKSYEKMVKEHGEGSKEAEKAASEYNKQAAALKNLERYVDGVQKELEQFQEEQRIANSNWTKFSQKLDEASSKMKTFGDRTKGIGDIMSKGVTAPILGLSTAAGLAATNFDSSTVKIRNSLGLTAKEAKELTSISRDIYKKGFGESAEEIERALIQTRQNIRGLNKEDLGRITQKAYLLAETFEADVNEVTRAGNNLMKGFGIEADKAFDLMAHGAQNGLNFSNEMFDNLSEYSTLFASMGYSAEEYFQLLINGTEAGVYNLDYINDVMKEFQIRVKDGSKSTSDAMGALSKDSQKVWKEFLKGNKTVKDVSNKVLKELKGMDNQVKANEIGVALFGTKWEDLEAEAMYALGGIEGGLKDVEGTMGDMTKNAEKSISQQWKSIWREAKAAVLPLGEELIDFAKDVLPDVKDGIKDVSDWFANLDKEGKKNILVLGGIAAAAGPVLSVFGHLTTGVGELIKVTSSLSQYIGEKGGAGLLGKIGLLGPAAATPVGLAIAGVGALGVGIYALTQASKDNLEETAKNIEKRKEEIESLDETIARYEELQGKNKLSTDEVLRYMDIMDELKKSKNEKTIAALTEEQNRLLEKSGLTNVEIDEFLTLNETIVKNSPSTAAAISEQGNAYAETAEAAKELNDIEKERLSGDLYNSLTQQIDQHIDNLKDQAEYTQKINELEEKRAKHSAEALESERELIKIDQELNKLDAEQVGLTIEQRDKIREQIAVLESKRRMHEQIINENNEEIAQADKKIAKQQEKLDGVTEEVNLYNDMIKQYESLLLAEKNIVDEKGNAYQTIQDARAALHEQRMEQLRLLNAGEITTKEYNKQIGKIKEQEKAIDEVQKSADTLNTKLSKDIDKDIGLKTNPSINTLNRDLASSLTKRINIDARVNGAAAISPYAKGTPPQGHPGGHAVLGDGIGINAGRELVKLPSGKMFLSANQPTLYPNLPKGTHVIPAKKTKQLLKSTRFYASGTRNWADLFNLENANDFMKLLAILGKGIGVQNNNASKSNTNNQGPSRRDTNITQNITINSPEPLSPSETARRFKQVSRQLAMEFELS